MRKRRFIIIALLLGVNTSTIVAMLWFASPQKATFPIGYAAVTNKIAQMRPSIRPDGIPRGMWAHEEVPGALEVLHIHERGDPKFGPSTVVRVKKVSDTTTSVTLTTRQHVLFGLFERRTYFTERRRWRELLKILHQ